MATFISADGKSYITVPDQNSSGKNMLDSHGRIIGVVQSNGNILSPNGTLIGNTQDRKY